MALYRKATIAAGASVSDEVKLSPGETLLCLEMPSAWTAASITFTAVVDPTSTTFLDVYDDSGEFTISTAAASRYIIIPNGISLSRFKIRSGTAATPVNQVAAAVINIVTRYVG
jgi:hypothetical protein